MSSTYYALCMSHDPALVIDGGWSKLGDITTAVQLRSDEAVRAHATCDLLIGRLSGNWVEFGCPGGQERTQCFHNDMRWDEASWLRLLFAAHRSTDANVAAATKVVSACWTPTRMLALRDVLGGEW